MPCDQVRTTTVQWTEATDLKKVAAALSQLGFTDVTFRGSNLTALNPDTYDTVNFIGGRLSFQENVDVDVDRLKQLYAVEVVKDAEQFGWTVEVQDGPKQKVTAGFTREW
jgi:hypothetical protein